MQFVLEPRCFMEQFCENVPIQRRPGQCKQNGNEEKKWQHKINLTQIPTKPEDLSVKMEKESNTLSVSGKSEGTKERNSGLKISSIHSWSKLACEPPKNKMGAKGWKFHH